MTWYRRFGKRAFDILVVAVASPIWVPLACVVTVLVRLRLGTPVLFRQRRGGRAGVVFELVKFRTMTQSRGTNGQLLPDEGRMTRFGSILRRTSLDELPSLFNILLGHMSLVGPRPLPERYLPRYSPRDFHRHDVRPGLTGLAQVNGRNVSTWEERFVLDLKYVRELSFMLDLRILLRTAAVVLTQDGASPETGVTTEEFRG